jgi:uncharacterized protein (DUF362 family)
MRTETGQHPGHGNRPGILRQIKHGWYRANSSLFVIGLLSLVWVAWRTGTKPSRAAYPCQQAAAAQGSLWLAAYIFPLMGAVKQRPRWMKWGAVISGLAIVVSIIGVPGLLDPDMPSLAATAQKVDIDLRENLASAGPASSIFAVKGASGKEGELGPLLNLMGTKGAPFYKSGTKGERQGPDGLIGRNDTLIIKVNSQWDERGGTNTDLVKSLIEAITHHPDGFDGEIVVADNGQAQYGLNGKGGSLDYSRNNAEDHGQSMQKVVDSFGSAYRISTYQWDTITTKRAGEFEEENLEDGYVLSKAANSRTGEIVSYPKFRTKFNTYISFKKGIWNAQTGAYDGDNLKIINVPVLKTHGTYGVTASVKHYMGVGSDKLTSQAGSRMHNTVGSGGMGTEMAETRFPTLNILDAIWINAVPGRGPATSYTTATRTGIIAASRDPIALDQWAAKNILVQAANKLGYTNTSSMDPESTAERSFGRWLKLSMQEIVDAGYQATADESRINIYVSAVDQATTSSPAQPAANSIQPNLPSIMPPTPATAVARESSTSTRTAEKEPSANWLLIISRILIPVLVAGVFIGIINYRRKKKKL